MSKTLATLSPLESNGEMHSQPILANGQIPMATDLATIAREGYLMLSLCEQLSGQIQMVTDMETIRN